MDTGIRPPGYMSNKACNLFAVECNNNELIPGVWKSNIRTIHTLQRLLDYFLRFFYLHKLINNENFFQGRACGYLLVNHLLHDSTL